MADDSQLAEATAPLSFAEFLDRMKDPAAADLVRSIKNFIRAFEERKPDPERDSELVQMFFSKSEGAFRQHPVWAAGPSEHQAQAIEGLEKYLMTKIYLKTFAISDLDRERDQALTMRLTALKFVRPEHLDIPQAYMDAEWCDRAMRELSKINSYKAPRDKLVCVLNCSRVINNLLNNSSQQGKARGADDFLPVLIYVVIHANPSQLASNLEYIQRFRMRSRMVSESSYFFTQLYSAASFIETINPSSLTMDPEEFKARMIAAGVPDMQLYTDASPAAAFKSPVQQHPVPQEAAFAGLKSDTGADAKERKGLSASSKGSYESNVSSTQQQQPRHLSNLESILGGMSVRNVAEFEAAGIPHVLKAESEGKLRSRHPFIYASTPDLRLRDVETLLAAYKRIVLKYEALSLLFSPEGEQVKASLQGNTEQQNEPPLSNPPPAVEGPNPFFAAGSSSPRRQDTPDIGEPVGNSIDATRTEGSKANTGRIPTISDDVQISVSKPLAAEQGLAPSAAASEAAAAIDRATAQLPVASRVSCSPRSLAPSLGPSRSPSMQPALSDEALGTEGKKPGGLSPAMLSATSDMATHASLKDPPGLVTSISEPSRERIELVQPDIASPFDPEESELDVEFPACPVPTMFPPKASSEASIPRQKPEQPSPLDQPIEDAVELPSAAYASPFDDFVEDSVLFPTSSEPSPFEADTPPSSQQGEGKEAASHPSRVMNEQGSDAGDRILTGFENSPFAASAAAKKTFSTSSSISNLSGDLDQKHEPAKSFPSKPSPSRVSPTKSSPKEPRRSRLASNSIIDDPFPDSLI